MHYRFLLFFISFNLFLGVTITYLVFDSNAKKDISSFLENITEDKEVNVTYSDYGMDFGLNYYIKDLVIANNNYHTISSKKVLFYFEDFGERKKKYTFNFKDLEIAFEDFVSVENHRFNDFRDQYVKNGYLTIKNLNYYHLQNGYDSIYNMGLTTHQNDYLNVEVFAKNPHNIFDIIKDKNKSFNDYLIDTEINKVVFDFENRSVIENILKDAVEKNDDINNVTEAQKLIISRIEEMLSEREDMDVSEKKFLKEIISVIDNKKGFLFTSEPKENKLELLAQSLLMMILTNKQQEVLNMLNLNFESKK